jgi:hypothetical protein
VETTFYAEPELAAEALARGDADSANGTVRAFCPATAKGAGIVSIIEQVANEFQILAIPEIRECADLDGKRFSISGESAANSAMSFAYIDANCPGIEPQIVIISGSENRAAALLADEIDASPLELADVLQIEKASPGKFHTLTNFAQDPVSGLHTGDHGWPTAWVGTCSGRNGDRRAAPG